jgi:hypothetical protein
VLSIVLSKLLAQIYFTIFGFKAKPAMDWGNGEIRRRNLHYADALITLIIGLILFTLTVL